MQVFRSNFFVKLEVRKINEITSVNSIYLDPILFFTENVYRTSTDSSGPSGA